MSEPLGAGGTLAQPALGMVWKLERAGEMLALFLAAPIAMRYAVHGQHIPLFLALLPILAIALLLLAADPTFRLRGELSRGVPASTLVSIASLAVIGGACVALWVREMHPDWFLEFPRNRPELYARIMLLYPLASVAAQELVYRTFYFHRYGPLFGSQRWLAILFNALLFGFAHIVIGNPFAILATTATGLLFALRYAATRSYWAVFLEHTLWGWLAFTVGLGRYFFTGVSNV